MSRQAIFAEIEAERAYQDSRWGSAFDEKNTLNDWVTYINSYATQATAFTATPALQRLKLLKTAALAVAALETFDRTGGFAPRHYEDQVAK